MKSLFAFLFALVLLTAGCNAAPKVAPKVTPKAAVKADHSVVLAAGLLFGLVGAAIGMNKGTTKEAPLPPSSSAPVAPKAPEYREIRETFSPTWKNHLTSVPASTPTVAPTLAPIEHPQFKPAHTPKHFVIDGTNVCRCYAGSGFKLETLLTLVTCILEEGNTFECYFDASTRYVARRCGSQEIQTQYRSLLQRYPVLFRETPAGEPADDTILLRADRANCTVISNDLFKKPEDQHTVRFPWVNNRDRIFRGRQYQDQLVVNRLNIDRIVPATLNGALKEFEAALANFGVAAFPSLSSEVQLAA